MGRIGTAVICAGLAFAGAALTASTAETRVEKLGDDIWRVRVSRDGSWREGHLNRYGVIEKLPVLETSGKIDFAFVKPTVSLNGKGYSIRIPLAKDERVYGLGDVNRDCLERRGRAYDIWVENVTSYIPIPMAMTSRGWGILVNESRRHTFDVGKTDPDALTVSAAEGDVDFYLFRGRDYRELLGSYTRLTGRPALLPAFAYGFAYVANQWVDMYEFVEEAYRFRNLGIPCDIVGLEPGWMEYYYDFTTKKTWNSARFGFPYWMKPKERNGTWIGGLDHMGFKLSLWLCMDYDLFVFEDACAEGRDSVVKSVGVQKDEDGGNKSDVFYDPHIYGDFSNEKSSRAARLKETADGVKNVKRQPVMRPDGLSGANESGREPWFKHLTKFVDRGARCFKLDGSCQVTGHKGRVWAGKYPEAEVHNLYPLVYGKQMAEGFETYTGERAMVYSAGGYAGIQRYVATWAGDTGGGARPLVSVLNLGMSGHPNQSCDMCIEDVKSVHFGIFAPWSQQNNWDSFLQPWYFGPEVRETLKKYVRLRYRLFPYLYGTGAVAARTGWPVARPLAFAYPQVAEYANEVGTYMLGDALLVSAFVDTVKIPAGTWYEWRSGKVVTGPTALPVETSAEWGGALYVKAGAIVPMWPQKDHLERGWNDVVELHVWTGADGEAELYEDDGATLGYRKGECSVTPLSFRGGVLSVGARRGSFKGMPATHRMRAVFHTPKGVVTTAEKSVGADGASFGM